MKYITFLLLLPLVLASCTSNRYNIATHSERESAYRILSVRDSSLLVVPSQYDGEFTPELIREYAKVIPFDSLTVLRREASSGIGEMLLGMFGGSLAGVAIGAATYSQHGNDLGALATAIDHIAIGGLLGFVVGGVAGYLLHPGEVSMLPPSRHLRDLHQSEYYRWGEPPELRQIK